jgi:hypothetical protein
VDFTINDRGAGQLDRVSAQCALELTLDDDAFRRDLAAAR